MSVNNKANSGIRNFARSKGIYLWQIALYLGISEPTIIRWLRAPLTKEREDNILTAIENIAKEVANGDK